MDDVVDGVEVSASEMSALADFAAARIFSSSPTRTQSATLSFSARSTASRTASSWPQATDTVRHDRSAFDAAVACRGHLMNKVWTVTASGFDSLDVEYFKTDDFSPTQRAISHRTMHLVKTGG
jgi:hypothetical protein